mgnify:CR=1 FL=1
MPEILVKLAFGEYEGDFGILNPCKEDMFWVRGIDIEPVLVNESEINKKLAEYNRFIKQFP